MKLACSLVSPFLFLPTAALAQNAGLVNAHGTLGYVDIPFAVEMVPTAITVEAWVTYDDTTLQAGNAWPTVFRQNSTPGQESYFLRVQGGSTSNTVMRWSVVGTRGRANVDWTFTSGQLLQWTHLAATYDGSTAELFVDGVSVGTGTGSGRIINRGNTLRIGDGDLSTPGAEVWNGEIDEVRLWPFARTAGEILATKDLQIQSVPGLVSTWNLNGMAQDSSGAMHGSLVGGIQFAGNTLSLTPFPFPGARAYGASSQGCRGAIPQTITSLPRIGNADFGWACTKARSSTAGGLLLGFGQLQNPVRVLGVDIWVDTSSGSLFTPAASDARGVAKSPLPIPNNAALSGGRLFTQYFWIDPCVASGLTASDGLALTVLN